jgi:hypothetical protein
MARESQAIEGDGCEKNEEEMAFNERIGVHTNLTVMLSKMSEEAVLIILNKRIGLGRGNKGES